MCLMGKSCASDSDNEDEEMPTMPEAWLIEKAHRELLSLSDFVSSHGLQRNKIQLPYQLPRVNILPPCSRVLNSFGSNNNFKIMGSGTKGVALPYGMWITAILEHKDVTAHSYLAIPSRGEASKDLFQHVKLSPANIVNSDKAETDSDLAGLEKWLDRFTQSLQAQAQSLSAHSRQITDLSALVKPQTDIIEEAGVRIADKTKGDFDALRTHYTAPIARIDQFGGQLGFLALVSLHPTPTSLLPPCHSPNAYETSWFCNQLNTYATVSLSFVYV
ncbi:hypothetical protein RND81_01G090600 [Saponaria officinalis]|uniref:Uncharacterized protein n=1 Tax=Saponaria officinalis TaxID=3572 RepID=A0AAW1NHM7_SAPOF